MILKNKDYIKKIEQKKRLTIKILLNNYIIKLFK